MPINRVPELRTTEKKESSKPYLPQMLEHELSGMNSNGTPNRQDMTMIGIKKGAVS